MKTVIMATLIIILGFVSAGGAEAKPAAGTVLYVSTVGSDDWSGRLPSPNGPRTDGPLASLDKTRAVVRKIAAKGLTEPLTVLIRGGEYFLDSTLVFGPEDSGTATCPITYKAYPNEKPVFSGAKQLKEWTRCSEEIEGLPAAARGQIWSTEVPKGDWRVLSLFDGLEALPRSRSAGLKASKDMTVDKYNEEPKRLMNKLNPTDDPVIFSRELRYQGSDLRNWPNEKSTRQSKKESACRYRYY